MRKLYILCGKWLYPILLPLMRIVIRRTRRAYVAIVYDKQLILIKNWLARDTWRLPGGGVSKGESPATSVLREVKEELRLVLSKTKLIQLNEGIMQTDRLGYTFTHYAYVLDTFPRRLEDKYEIVDYGLFKDPPEGTQSEVLEVIDLLKKRKLL
jgi:8-oxo-dGTP pyrophosphatase MutT (NUDIX family)